MRRIVYVKKGYYRSFDYIAQKEIKIMGPESELDLVTGNLFWAEGFNINTKSVKKIKEVNFAPILVSLNNKYMTWFEADGSGNLRLTIYDYKNSKMRSISDMSPCIARNVDKICIFE